MLEKKQLIVIYLLLTACTIIAFWQVNHCDFINYDDVTYVTENSHIQKGISAEAIRWAFTTGHAANWHPLTWISHMVDVQLFGLTPRWHHLTNLLFHIANTLLLFFVLYRMTEAPWKSAFVAALFALHPLHVESVAWVAERKDVLSTFFWMLTMCAYVRYVEHPGRGGYLAVIGLFALGLMAKPMLVTLPFVLLLLDYWPLGRLEGSASEILAEAGRVAVAKIRKGKSSGRHTPGSSPGRSPKGVKLEAKAADDKYRWTLIRPLLLEKIPLFALAALSSIVTFIAQAKGGSVIPLEAISPGVRISNAVVSYIIYIGKMIWPDNLAIFYPHPGLRPSWQVFGAFLLLCAVTLSVVRMAKRFPYLAVGWLWFAGTLVPVIGIVQVGIQAMADRYTYIPFIGLFVMAAWGIPELLKNRPFRKAALVVMWALILPCLFNLTWTQVGYWHDSITMYDHTLKVTSRNDTIHNSRGDAYCRLGKLRQAIPDFDKAIEINPQNADAYYNRGVTYGRLGDHRQAIENFDRAIEIDPKRVEPYYNRGFAYDELGGHTQAISDYDKAIEIDPGNAQAYNSRGVAYGKLGNYSRAVADYTRAVEIDPGNARAFNNRGIAYGKLGNYTQAVADYTRAIEINPDYVKAYYNRGVAYSELGNQRQAIEDMKTAARFGDENASVSLKNMGISW